MPYRTIQWYLQTVHRRSLSVGKIQTGLPGLTIQRVRLDLLHSHRDGRRVRRGAGQRLLKTDVLDPLRALRPGSTARLSNTSGKQRRAAQLALEKRLLALCRPCLDDPLAVQGKLCRRIDKHLKELFVFVAQPEVPPDNNAAERSLLVISRKISGGTRSNQGTDAKMTLSSLFGTWRAQGLNPLTACRQLLTSPQL